MLNVTGRAKQQLKELLESKGSDPKSAIRLVVSPHKEGKLRMVIDEPQGNDQIVKNDGNEEILIFDSKLQPVLEGKVLDYPEDNQDAAFTLSNIPDQNSK
ncbi:MAG: hypothetical protein GF401_17320 [Chitinivibrionales bacterium]|nr:hypothetical protein [Chitinivibrionales bacterium]